MNKQQLRLMNAVLHLTPLLKESSVVFGPFPMLAVLLHHVAMHADLFYKTSVEHMSNLPEHYLTDGKLNVAVILGIDDPDIREQMLPAKDLAALKRLLEDLS